MAKVEMTTRHLGSLNGKTFGKEIDKELLEAIEHCYTHPGLKEARRVKIEVEFKPIADGLGNMGIQVTPSVVTTVPKAKGNPEFISSSFDGKNVKAFIITDEQDGLPFREGN